MELLSLRSPPDQRQRPGRASREYRLEPRLSAQNAASSPGVTDADIDAASGTRANPGSFLVKNAAARGSDATGTGACTMTGPSRPQPAAPVTAPPCPTRNQQTNGGDCGRASNHSATLVVLGVREE